MTNLNLLKDSEKKVFYHYLIPSICSTLVTSIYILVDTLIIGQGVGSDGISALNIFLPFFSIYNGIGLMFGLGGGILISTEEGIGNHKKADSYFNSSLIGTVIVGAIFTLLTNIYLEEIAKQLVLSKEVRPGWDIKALKECGYDLIKVDENMGRYVWDEKQKLENKSRALFMIVAK